LRRNLSEADVSEALREVRVALLEADVALPVVKDLVSKVRERAVGQEVIRSVSPAQQVVKIVNDAIVEALGGGEGVASSGGLDLNAPSPVPILMVGLQGSGKTTTSGKIALRLKGRDKKKVLLASLDVQRPAAQLQLAQLAKRPASRACPSSPARRRSRSPRAPWMSAAANSTTWSSSTPPAASPSTRR
jgi:signal recognition particle subunit SRP54